MARLANVARLALMAVLSVCLLASNAWGQSVDPSQWPLGGGNEESGKNDKPAADPAKSPKTPGEAAWITLKPKFKMVKKFEFALPPSGQTASVAGAKDGSVAVTGRLALPSPNLACTQDGKKLGIDLNGDAQPDVWAKSEKELQQLELTYDGNVKEPYAIELTRGAADAWSFARACYREATHKGTRVVLIDNDSDGAYDQVGVDAVLIGGARVPAYLSSHVVIGGKIFEMKVNRPGTEVQLRECGGPVGKVDLQSGFKAAGKLVGAVLTDGQRSFEVSVPNCIVPTGTYNLKWGVVDAGARGCMFRSSISVTVSEGQIAKVDFGAPFKLDFDLVRNGNRITVGASSLTVFGKTGEQYYDFSHSLVGSVEVRDEATKVGLCHGKMGAC